MQAYVVLKTLGYIHNIDAGLLVERSEINQELMGTEAILILELDVEVLF